MRLLVLAAVVALLLASAPPAAIAELSASAEVSSLAAKGRGGALLESCGARSFTGETLVLMADGSKKPIADVRVGDLVIATDPETGEQTPRKVSHGWVHDDTVIDLVIDGEVITTTEDHPFWSATDGEFQDAEELDPGEHVLTADGRLLVVRGLRPDTARARRAYNLTVEGIHTHHIGADAILVHNCATVNLASDSRTRHILHGDRTGGGHLCPGRPGKTPFPRGWDADRVMHEISDIATDLAATLVGRQGRRTVLEGTRGGVRIRVVTDGSDIITGYPTNLARNPR